MINLCNIFSGIELVATVCFIVGIIFLIIEIFVPGFGIFGIMGIILTAFSIVFKICIGNSIEEVLWSILIAFVIIIALLVVFIYSARKGLISKSDIMNSGTALPTFYSKTDLEFLIDEVGETITDLKPIGKIKVENEQYDAKSLDGYLETGVKIKVVSIENNTICVCKYFEKGESK